MVSFWKKQRYSPDNFILLLKREQNFFSYTCYIIRVISNNWSWLDFNFFYLSTSFSCYSHSLTPSPPSSPSPSLPHLLPFPLFCMSLHCTRTKKWITIASCKMTKHIPIPGTTPEEKPVTPPGQESSQPALQRRNQSPGLGVIARQIWQAIQKEGL